MSTTPNPTNNSSVSTANPEVKQGLQSATLPSVQEVQDRASVMHMATQVPPKFIEKTRKWLETNGRDPSDLYGAADLIRAAWHFHNSKPQNSNGSQMTYLNAKLSDADQTELRKKFSRVDEKELRKLGIVTGTKNA